MIMSKREITIIYKSEDKEQRLIYQAGKSTTVQSLLEFLYYEIEKNTFFNRSYEHSELLGCFRFHNEKYGEQRAILNYKLLSFLSNFNYDLHNVEIYYDQGYGWGATIFEFEELADIKINNNEPKHMDRPHVHICKVGKKDKGISISLTTFEPFPECQKEWNKRYKKKEQDAIINFLKENAEVLSDYYNRNTKGEYIMNYSTLAYNGKVYKFFDKLSLKL